VACHLVRPRMRQVEHPLVSPRMRPGVLAGLLEPVAPARGSWKAALFFSYWGDTALSVASLRETGQALPKIALLVL
jgi:hypothetical protein